MIKVREYQLLANNGRPVRKATKVIFEDGQTIKFMEKMSKQEAIKRALELIKQNPF